jgi:cephalosporin-C deacetylase-like acetyl esterase
VRYVILFKLFLLACSAPSILRAQPAADAAAEARWAVIPNVNAMDGGGVTPNSTAIAKLIGDAAEYLVRWQLPQDSATWREQRADRERAFRRVLGLDPLPERTSLDARIVRKHDMGDYTLENVILHSRPGFPITANLYRPKASLPGRRAAVLAPIGHALNAGKGVTENQVMCIQLARLGFVVLTYDAIGHGERVVAGNNHHEAGFALLPLGQTIAGWMVWESMRAIDFLLTLPEVDPERIGITGNSGGGLNTLFTAAIDSRIRAAAIAGYVFEFRNWMKYAGPHCTCTYLPAMYRLSEWFGIAGLIAPRAVLMLQGERDAIFPISGARIAGRSTEALYALLGHSGSARFDEVHSEPHAYSRPFRERMYGWMLLHLEGKGSGKPVAEGAVTPLAQDDPRLMCDAGGSLIGSAPSVVALARREAELAVARLPAAGSAEVRAAARRLALHLTKPPDPEPHHMLIDSVEKLPVQGGVLEKVSFLSETGQHVPSLLWLPAGVARPHRAMIIAHERGKAAVAESGMIQPLLEKGYAVLAVDTRGRGETLGRVSERRDNNFPFVAHSLAWDRPAAGRRAFDLMRAVDFLQGRKDLQVKSVALAGLGGDALPALLAGAADLRIAGVACSGWVNSFASQISAAAVKSRAEAIREWNSSAMRYGRINNGDFVVDLGAVLPSVLQTADIPDFASLIAPRRLLYCGSVDNAAPGADARRARFEHVLKAQGEGARTWYRPHQQLDAALLLEWLGQE